MVNLSKQKGEEVRGLARGSAVKHSQDGRVGYLLGKGSDDQVIPQVAVQWADMPQEEYVLAHLVEENK